MRAVISPEPSIRRLPTLFNSLPLSPPHRPALTPAFLPRSGLCSCSAFALLPRGLPTKKCPGYFRDFRRVSPPQSPHGNLPAPPPPQARRGASPTCTFCSAACPCLALPLPPCSVAILCPWRFTEPLGVVALQKVNREELNLHEHRLSPRASRGGQRRGRLVPVLSAGVKKFGPQPPDRGSPTGGSGDPDSSTGAGGHCRGSKSLLSTCTF